MTKLLRIAPGLIINLSDVREIHERDCGIYVTFISGIVKYYPDIGIEDIWDKLVANEDYYSTDKKGLVIL